VICISLVLRYGKTRTARGRSNDAADNVKILLADDHDMVRAGLRLLLERLFVDCVIIEAADYAQAQKICEAEPGLALVLIDRVMPGLAVGQDLGTLCNHSHNVPVIVMSASEDPAHVREALACGARGYLPKSTNEAILCNAIQLVLCGGTYLPTQLLTTEAVSDEQHCAAETPLTPRQMDILGCLSQGKTNKDIARDLHISPATVQTHINAIFRALSVSNRTQAVHVGSKLGLLRPGLT
jgi:DNA-binding NarL/FixJ family response regulator